MFRYFVFCFIVHCSTSKKWENTGCIRTHSLSDWSPTITSSIETRVVRRAARAPSSTATKVRRRMRTKRSIHRTATKTTARRILLVKATIRITQKRVHMATFTPRDGNSLYSFERSEILFRSYHEVVLAVLRERHVCNVVWELHELQNLPKVIS